MTEYFISSVAEGDIDEIVTYIAQENPNAALKLLDVIYESMAVLSSNPMLGHKREDITSKKVRFWPFKFHYLIIYTETDPIEIVRVLSGYRDISGLLI